MYKYYVKLTNNLYFSILYITIIQEGENMGNNFFIITSIFGVGFILYFLFDKKLKDKYPPWLPIFANGFEVGFLVAWILFSVLYIWTTWKLLS